MNPAHLGLLLAALPKERPAWKTTLKYLAEHSIEGVGVFFGSIKSLRRGVPNRVPLKLGEEKVKESIQALQNLRLIRVLQYVDGTGFVGQIQLLPGFTNAYVDELVLALSRPASWVDRLAARRLWGCLERRRSCESPYWADLGPRFLGEELTNKHLLSDEFLATPKQVKFPFGASLTKVDPPQGSTLNLDPGGGSRLVKLDPPSGSKGDPGWGSAVDRIVRASSTRATSSEDRGGSVDGREGTDMVKKTVDELLDENSKALRKGATQYKPGSKEESNRLKNRNGRGINNGPAKTVTSRMQNLKDWEHWRTTQPVLNKIFPEPCITLTPEGDIDFEASNPDAIQLIEFLQKGCNDLLKNRIGPNEVPFLLLQAWRAYARLFNLEYSGPGDMRMIPPLRLAFRRMTAGQTRMTKGEILSKMAGFVFRMDHLRRNRKGEFFPNQEWVAIYSPTSKYATAWQDALFSDPKIRDPMAYMLGVVPFVKPTNPDGTEVQAPPKSAAERLAEIRLIVKEGGAQIRPMHDLRHGEGAWDKLPEEERMDRVLDTNTMNEMRRLEKELSGDPANAAVRKP